MDYTSIHVYRQSGKSLLFTSVSMNVKGKDICKNFLDCWLKLHKQRMDSLAYNHLKYIVVSHTGTDIKISLAALHVAYPGLTSQMHNNLL